MKKGQLFIIGIFLLCVAVFFYPIFRGQIPFPGDLLVGQYFPYNSVNYDGYQPGAVPNKAQGPDVIKQLYPWKYFAIESLKHFQIPFWNPYNFSGNPLMANFQSGVFYPLNIVFFVLPFSIAWTLFIFLIPFLTCCFMYLYLREVRLGRGASIFGGLVFAFSSYMVVWMEYGNIGHTMLWLPLGLYLVEKLLKKFNLALVMVIILILTASILGGYIQGYFYIVGTLSFYTTTKMLLSKKRHTVRLLILLASFILPVLLTLFQFLPTLKLFEQSSRSNYSLEVIDKLLNPWWYAITVIAPDFFGHPASRNYWFYGTYIERVSFFGVIPFIFAVMAMFYWKRRIEVKIFSVLFIVAFLLSFNIFLTKFFYLIPIPVISTTVPTRILCIFVFSGAILSAIGMQEFLYQQKQKYIFLGLTIATIILLIGWFVIFAGNSLFHGQEWITNLVISKRNLILPSVFTGLFSIAVLFYRSKPRYKEVFLVMIFLLTFVDLFRFFHKITPFSPEAYIYPQTPIVAFLKKNSGMNRYWGYGSAAMETNFQMVDHTFTTDGNDPLHVRAYTEFVESSKNGQIPDMLPRPDANIAPGYGTDDMRRNIYRQKVLNILGVKYILHKFESAGPTNTPDEATFDPKRYKLVWQSGQYQIYENKSAAPRVFLTNNYRVVKNSDLLRIFYSQDFAENNTLLLDQDPKLDKQLLSQKLVSVIKYTPNHVIVKTNANTDALLFISDTMYLGWMALVDQKPQKIYTSDYAFRAIRVPKGNHVVEFKYKSQPFETGLIISSLTLVSILSLYFIFRKKSL
jgi:uncharacterized membrane protein YfhO